MGMLLAQGLLKRTELGEVWVWLLLGCVLGLSVLALRRPPSLKWLRQAFLLIAVAVHSVIILLFLVNTSWYWRILRDHHLVEWLTAHFLFAAALVGFLFLIRQLRLGNAVPLLAFFIAGYFVAFCRELEWGQPFFGQKVWYGRNMFFPHRWFDRGHFEALLQDLGIDQRLSVGEAVAYNAISSIGACIFSLVVAAYLFRHRQMFIEELSQIPRRACGRWFLAGLGLYLVAQIIEHLLGWQQSPLVYQGEQFRKLDEPLELFGAIAFWLSIMTWNRTGADEASEPEK
jgi:hypothetical protein